MIVKVTLTKGFIHFINVRSTCKVCRERIIYIHKYIQAFTTRNASNSTHTSSNELRKPFKTSKWLKCSPRCYGNNKDMRS